MSSSRSSASSEPIADDLAAAWLAVEREAGDEPVLTEHAGVWLVAIGLSSFERAWAAIRSATAGGQLGPSARVGSSAHVPVAARLERAATGD